MVDLGDLHFKGTNATDRLRVEFVRTLKVCRKLGLVLLFEENFPFDGGHGGER